MTTLRPIHATLLALSLLLPAACAQSPGRPQPGGGVGGAARSATPADPAATAEAAATDPADPLEPVNRRILDFNLALDECCIRPLALGYRRAVHPWVRTRIRNVISTIHEPRHAANALLQGDPLGAGTSAMRFVVNATLGLGGMFDLEPIGGPPLRPRDFGQTLYAWGLRDGGPYLMVPVTGPSNPRDFAGGIADGFVNPISWALPLWGNLARTGVDGLDLREQNVESLDALRGESLDFYARLRSVWQQRRAAELARGLGIRDGIGVEFDPDPAVLDDPGAPQAPEDAGTTARPGAAVAPAGASRPAAAAIARRRPQAAVARAPAARPVVARAASRPPLRR